MPNKHKAIFLPVDEKILTLFQGYVLNGVPLKDVSESELYEIKMVTEYNSGKYSIPSLSLRVVIAILILPFIIIFSLVAHFFKKSDVFFDKAINLIDFLAPLRDRKNKGKREIKTLKKQFANACMENVKELLEHCKIFDTKVYLYGYNQLNADEKQRLDHLIKSGLVVSYWQVSNISNLPEFIQTENISLHNSMIVVKSENEIEEAISIGYHPNSTAENQRDIFWWKTDIQSNSLNRNEAAMNGRELLYDFKHEISNAIKSSSNYFYPNHVVLFIEDEFDDTLNDFIAKNLERFNKALSAKGMVLFYYPAIRNSDFENNPLILNFIKSCIPQLHALTDDELKLILQKTFEKLSPKEFYDAVVNSLELPYFQKPCLLRSVYGGSYESINKFRTRAIEYNSIEDLEKFFNTLIAKVEIPDDYKGVLFSLKKPPEEYDADWYFSKELSKDSEEFKAKIDAIKAKGEFGLLAEAMLYMMETLKNENPEILKKVKPLIENKKLLQTNVALSPIVIDKHFNIFLTDYGNTEVKMHALPKTVFLLFLRYPDGIKFKELFEYKAELLEIYNKVTNKSEKDEIAKTIDDLVDMRNPSINQKCARVREAFRNIMEEHLAKSYYIDGYNSEPKKIALPRSLVTFTD